MEVDTDNFYDGLVAGGYESFLGGLNVDDEDDEVEELGNADDTNADPREQDSESDGSSSSSDSDVEYENDEDGKGPTHSHHVHSKDHVHSKEHVHKHSDGHSHESDGNLEKHLEAENTIADDPDLVEYEETNPLTIDEEIHDKHDKHNNHDMQKPANDDDDSSSDSDSSSSSDSDDDVSVQGGGTKVKKRSVKHKRSKNSSKSENKPDVVTLVATDVTLDSTSDVTSDVKPRLDNLLADYSSPEELIKNAVGSSDGADTSDTGDTFGTAPDVTDEATAEPTSDAFGTSPDVLDVVGTSVSIDTAANMEGAVQATLDDFGTSDLLTNETVNHEVTTDHTSLTVVPEIAHSTNAFGDAEDLFASPADIQETEPNTSTDVQETEANADTNAPDNMQDASSKIEIEQTDIIKGSSEPSVFGAALRAYKV